MLPFDLLMPYFPPPPPDADQYPDDREQDVATSSDVSPRLEESAHALDESLIPPPPVEPEAAVVPPLPAEPESAVVPPPPAEPEAAVVPPPPAEPESAVVPPPPAEPEAAVVPPPARSVRRFIPAAVMTLAALAAFGVAGKFLKDDAALSQKAEAADQTLKSVEKAMAERRALVEEYSQREARIEQINREIDGINEQGRELRSEINVLSNYARAGVLDNQLKNLTERKTILGERLAELDRLQRPFLPPSAFSEEELQQRDASLRGVVNLYLRAREKGFLLIQKGLFAPSVMHKESKFRDVSVGELFRYLEEEWVKNPPSGLHYELLELAYSGNRIELILRRSAHSTSDGRTVPVAYCKERWWLDEKGKIRRWDEEISASEKPAVSSGFRSVKLSDN